MPKLIRLLAHIAVTPLKVKLILRNAKVAFLCFLAKRKDAEVQKFARTVFRRFREKSAVCTKVSMGFNPRPGHGNLEHLKLCWDAPIGITVWFNDEPALGLGCSMHRNFLFVWQLQGVAGITVPPELRDWPKLFIEACMEYAELSGMKGVRVYRAQHSTLFEHPYFDTQSSEEYRTAVVAHQQRMRRRYDGTARQMGFTMRPRWGEWLNEKHARS